MAHTPNKPTKPHVPYRNDPAVGKKTGIAIARVERTSDGFERFDRVLNQANSKTAPRRNRSRKSAAIDADQEEEEDEGGESSMDLDSPVQYATTPRASTSSRPVSRGSQPIFNSVPSPRTPKSGGHAGPSRLGNTLTARELLEQDEEEYDGGMYNLSQVDDFGDDEEEEEEQVEPARPMRGRGTPAPSDMRQGRVVDEEDEEDEIARGMSQIDDEDEELQEEETPPPPRKKARATPSPSKSKQPKLQSRKKKENRDTSEVPEGVRRSKRVPIPPLDFWRGEKYVYGPRVAGQKRQVPHIAEIVRIPKEDPVPSRAGVKRKRSRAKSQPAAVVREREVIVEVPVEGNPEEGWDDDTNPDAVVLDYPDGQPVTRRVAFTARMFKPTPVGGGQWLFQKVFGDGDFMAAGQLVIPAQGRKPAKGTKDNTYIFYVVEGAVSVVIGETPIVLATGGMFMVPRNNSYLIENIAERDAKLFFTQARKIGTEEEEAAARERESAAPRGVSVAMAGSSRAAARSGSSGSTR
ncbi:Mif2/CENP-C like-domain-containing protein [Mycena galericulata]|nr:Mif2/CENP-C like-domain-containing protein [Mycena galericulata]